MAKGSVASGVGHHIQEKSMISDCCQRERHYELRTEREGFYLGSAKWIKRAEYLNMLENDHLCLLVLS